MDSEQQKAQIASVLSRAADSTRQPYKLTYVQQNPIVGPGTYEPHQPQPNRSVSISSAPRTFLLKNKNFTSKADPENPQVGPGTYTPIYKHSSNFAFSQTSRYQYKATCWSQAVSGDVAVLCAEPNPQTYQKVSAWRSKSAGQNIQTPRNLVSYTIQERMAEKHAMQKNYTPGPGHFNIRRGSDSQQPQFYKTQRNMEFKINLNPHIRGKAGNDVPGPGSYNIRGMTAQGGFRVNRGIYMSKYGRGWDHLPKVTSKTEKLEIDY
ncbi:hypothetical protein SS50377_28041 [Spironucleus salmonicida]|uniref:Uncharacterized protein n=1 Tax=Spironucleus salmonicida TaxID=348837 RepID=V6LDK9_9EUKA|nr:hypothetical protein SS50377_28041 [Spironucleus salmonicida]|eukprot:EST42595.1 Hypothetical protein SS50377_17914 [Spironucleus salmonicida]